MAIPKMTEDLNIIQKLSNLPNTEDGLTAEDLKARFDEAGLATQNFINETLIPALVAAKIPFAPTNEINAETIQAAIENVQAQVKDAASGTIVNGSITKEKIASALLERIYGGRVWVSADTPDEADNVAADFPIGQIWLRPRFTVINEAGDSWSGSGCTAAVSGNDVTITGSAQVASVTATQNLSGIGEQGDRVYILFSVADKDSEITSLSASVNGADAVALAGDMALETTLFVGGTLSVQFGIQWPSTSLATGSVTMKSYTVVNVDKIMRQMTGAKEIEYWENYLWEKVPFTAFTSPEALFAQTNNGVWRQIVFDVLPVERGGTGLNVIGKDQFLVGGDNNSMKQMSAEGVVALLGTLRMQTGSYTGNGANRTIALPLEPKFLYLYCTDGPLVGGSYASADATLSCVDAPAFLANGATWGEGGAGEGTSIGYSLVKLSGSSLAFSHSNASGRMVGNRSGKTYNWVALY